MTERGRIGAGARAASERRISPAQAEVYHFTHLDNLPSVVSDGLMADSTVGQRLANEAGEPYIKDLRRRRAVPVGPGGVVGDQAGEGLGRPPTSSI